MVHRAYAEARAQRGVARGPGSPVREICTPGSAGEDGHKSSCRFTKGTGAKAAETETGAMAKAARPASTHHLVVATSNL